MARARRQFATALLIQLPPQGRFRQGRPKFVMEPPRQIDQSPADTPWIAGIGPLSTISARAMRWASFNKEGLPGALSSRSLSEPWSLNRTTQSRTICNVTPPIIECSGNHFPQAVKLLLDLDLLRAVSHLDMITYRLAKTLKDEDGNFATRIPRDTLALLDALIADDRAQRPYELGKVLEVIAEPEPMLRQTKSWRRLQDLTI